MLRVTNKTSGEILDVYVEAHIRCLVLGRKKQPVLPPNFPFSSSQIRIVHVTDDPQCSSLNSVILVSGTEWIIYDLNSVNGTHIGGEIGILQTSSGCLPTKRCGQIGCVPPVDWINLEGGGSLLEEGDFIRVGQTYISVITTKVHCSTSSPRLALSFSSPTSQGGIAKMVALPSFVFPEGMFASFVDCGDGSPTPPPLESSGFRKRRALASAGDDADEDCGVFKDVKLTQDIFAVFVDNKDGAQQRYTVEDSSRVVAFSTGVPPPVSSPILMLHLSQYDTQSEGPPKECNTGASPTQSKVGEQLKEKEVEEDIVVLDEEAPRGNGMPKKSAG